MMKHVGRHNNRKVVILYRQVPNEEHMALVSYSDALPVQLHDEVMKVVESEVGQQAKELADAIFRNLLPDGRNALEVLHREGFIKKVPTNQVLVTPNTNSSVRLDELNDILNEMAKGEQAIKRLADLDQNQGLITRKRAAPREVGMPEHNNVSRTNASVEGTISAAQALTGDNGILSDSDLAAQRLTQAASLKLQAQQMLAEATRLEKEAQQLGPTTDVSKPTKTSKKATGKKQAA